jgi:DNA replication and repair protein RecF
MDHCMLQPTDDEIQCSPHRGVERLSLFQFRSYETFHHVFDLGPVILTGQNGVGKTSLLEALSLLIPGRGLRRARLSDITKQDGPGPWTASYHLRDAQQELQIGTGQDPEVPTGERRVVRINGEKAKSQLVLSQWVSVSWLTPHMDRLFLDGPSERRRFLDRLVYGFDPNHAQRLSRYERVLKERNLLLRQGHYDRHWIEGLEETLVCEGVAITTARREVVTQLMTVLKSQAEMFPAAKLELVGCVETLMQERSSLEAEEDFRRLLADNREKDRFTGRTSIGPHRSELFVTYSAKNQAAAICSTGEQKALLLAIVMASARLLSVRTGAIPLLLLDEVVAHLDKSRRTALFEAIVGLNMQVWLTGTDVSLFEELQGRAQFCELGG